MKYRKLFVISIALALSLCVLMGGWQPGRVLAAGADDTGVTPKTIVQEYSSNTQLSSTTTNSYTGDVRVDSNVTLDLNGQQLTITGNLEVLGTLHINNGSLVVKSGGVTIDGGLLQMTQDSTTTALTSPNTVSITGSFTANGKDETGQLTAGTITVKGNFIQYSNYSIKSFCPTGTKVVISGAGRYVSFDSPANSWLGAYDFPSGTTFNSQSKLSFNLNLSNATNDFSAYPHLSIQGQMNGKALTVPANTVIEGPLTLGGGQLTAKGALLVDYYGGITMANANDKITVDGNFTTGGVCNCSAGTVQINGNFSQYGVVKGFHDNSWVCSPANITKITGANRVVNFDSPSTSCFGQLDTSGATITTGSMLSLNFDLSGDTSLSYTVASICYSGHLNGHKLTVPSSPFFAVRQIVLGGGTLDVSKSFTAASDNCLIMTNANDHVIARGDFTSSGKMDAASITAGSIDLYGNFMQTGNPASFIAGGANVTTLFKANATIQFNNPGQSWFGKLALAAGASLSPAGTLSMKCDLAGNQAYTVQVLYYGGSLDGNNLTVNGNLHIIGNTDVGSGTLKATGTVTLDGALTMADISGRLEADGNFSGSGTATLTAGSAEYKSGFHYSGTSYAASGTHSTILSGGANTSVIFDHPAQSYFGKITLSPGTTLSSGSVLCVKATGLSDMTFNVPRLYLQGDLGGKAVSLTGSLTVPSGASLNINGGSLNATGNMVLDGLLVMKNASDSVSVGGSFTAEGPDETNNLTNGKLTVNGNFTQLSTASSKSFAASGSHITILPGITMQHIYFANPSLTNGSAFAQLYEMWPQNLQPDTLFYYLNVFATSYRLSNIDGDGGTLIPAFSKETTQYIYLLPKNTDQTTITPYKEFQNAAMTIDGNSVDSVNVSGVPYDGCSTVQIAVSSLGGAAQRTYTVKVERLNVDLAGIGVSTGSLSPSFDANTKSYEVDIPASQPSVTITPAADNPDSTFTINGVTETSAVLSPKPGETVNATIRLTGQDGTTSNTYTVSVKRAPMLSGIAATAGTFTPAFDPDTPASAYTLNLGILDSNVTITPQAESGVTYTIDSISQASAAYNLAIGEQKQATITATAGAAQFTYVVTIVRANIISSFGLSPSAGTELSPSFNPNGGSYTLTIPASVFYLSVTPVKVNCTKLTINGQVQDSIALNQDNLPPGGHVTLAINAQYGNTVSASFTLTVTKKPIITNLQPSEGVLTQKADKSKHTFDPTVTEYYVDLSATDDPISVKPTILSGAVTVNGQVWNSDDPLTINPAPGATGVFTIVGTDGSGTATYKINVVRHKPVSALTLSTGSLSPAFSASAGTYTVSLPVTTASITITPAKTAQCTSLKINNVSQNSLTVALPLGGTADVEIEATEIDQYGSTVTVYDISIDRETLISDVDASSGTFSPDFDGCTLNYSLYLSSTTSSVTLTPQKTSSCKSFTINGKAVSHLKLAVPAGGMAIATVQAVGNPSSITQKFTIKVYRIAPVTAIKVSSGTLSPAFALSKADYTVNVPASKASVTITLTKAASCASLTIDGVSKSAVTLSPMIGTSVKTTIVAVAVNGSKYTWTVTVSRKAMLNGITLSTGKLSPAYSVTTMGYTVSVPATTASVKVSPLRASGVRSMTINGHSVSSVTLKPSIGGNATATIVLTAGDGKTKQTYTVKVQRDPLLTGIAPSTGTISPAFDPAKLTYTVTLPADTSATRLTFTKAATGVKSITINNVGVTFVDMSVTKPGGSSTVKIVATATNGTTTATYTVVVKRAPVLSSITVTGGTLSPAFSAATASYTVSVPVTTTKVTLKPTGAAGCSFLSINGVAVSSMDFYPPVGGSVTATIIAKTALGTTSTYSVTITRAALITAIKTSSSTYKISPAFSATTLQYTVNIPSSRSGITIYATKASKNVKSVKMNGHAVTSLLVKPPVGGSVVVWITATATNGTTVTYKVTVNRAA